MSFASPTMVRVTEGGRIVIPAAVRKKLGLKTGSIVVLTEDADSATLMNPKAARRRARLQTARYVKPNESLVAELMAERKRAARHE